MPLCALRDTSKQFARVPQASMFCPYRLPRCQDCDGTGIDLPGHVKRACSSFVGCTRLASQGYPYSVTYNYNDSHGDQ